MMSFKDFMASKGRKQAYTATVYVFDTESNSTVEEFKIHPSSTGETSIINQIKKKTSDYGDIFNIQPNTNQGNLVFGSLKNRNHKLVVKFKDFHMSDDPSKNSNPEVDRILKGVA